MPPRHCSQGVPPKKNSMCLGDQIRPVSHLYGFCNGHHSVDGSEIRLTSGFQKNLP